MNTKFVHFFCILAFVLCFGYFFYVSVMGFKGNVIPDQVKEIIIGVLGIAGNVAGYVVGSSVSSRAKDQAMMSQTGGQAPPINNQNQQP